MENKPTLSWSALSQYTRCPRQYWFARVARVPTGPKASALIEGSVGHSALEYFYRAKLERKELSEAEVLDYFDSFWAAAIQLEEVRWEAPIESRRKAVASALAAHLEVLAPRIDPRLIEASWRIELPECSFDLLGVVDIVDVHGAIWDHKFYNRMPQVNAVHEDGQMTCYDLARRLGAFGDCASDKLYLGVMVKGGGRTAALETKRSDAERAWFRRQVVDIAKAIDSGAAWFPNIDTWAHSPKWCDYWENCMEMNNA